MSPKVTQVPHHEWPLLRDLFKKDWPRDILPYHLIQNYIDWRQKDPEYVDNRIQVNCLDGDWSDGSFYVLDGRMVFFYTLNDDLGKLEELLVQLPQKGEYLGACIYERHLPVIERVLSRVPEWVLKFKTMTHLHHIPKERAASYTLDIPEGITLKPMNQSIKENALTVDSVYPFRTEGITVKGFEVLIKFNINIGAFDKNDKLVAWCLVYQSGVLNALQVLDDGQKRKGLGGLVVKAMAKEMVEKGWDTFGCIVDGNVPSMNLFKKLGFDIIDRVHWVGFGSKGVKNFEGQNPYAKSN